MSLQLHRPDGKGGLELRTVTDEDWHNQLRSPRWGASLKGGKPPKLANPEMNPTSTAKVDRVLGRARADHVRDHRRRLRHGGATSEHPADAGTAAPVVTVAAPATPRRRRRAVPAAS